MSQSGKLVFYSTAVVDDPQLFLRRILSVVKPSSINVVFRTQVEDRDWEDFLADGPGIPLEMLKSPMGEEEFVKSYRDGLHLSAELVNSHFSPQIGKAIQAAIPQSIRGDFLPWDLYFSIGFHDLWENAEHDDGHLFARAFVSFRFFSYSTPNDWPAFRQLVFDIPEVQAVKRDLERITGPLKQCIYWSI